MSKDQPAKMLVTMTLGELEEVVDRAVAKLADEKLNGPSYLTNVQVGEMLGVCSKTVNHLVKQGLPAIRIGRELRFERAAVVEWLRVNRSEGDGPTTPSKKSRGHLRSV